ncbi:MAG: acetyl-CoA carboxylase biotin carboxylase subunit [Alphaproteobacteria bacterium]|nr:acetyl-CoA carboxylase biotin carboxylase subunit [Alphaproteobacteria bacterium]
MKKILIANRGEIAVRIIRAAKEMNIATVAVYSEADKEAMHVKIADEAICIGPAKSADSYLNKQAILSAAIITGSDGIHPGYGFLSENADFVEMVETHGFTFIGPASKHIRIMGDKIQAKKTAIELGIPTVPGSDGEVVNLESAKKIANDFGYPVIIKAAAGGGGRGMRIAFNETELTENFDLTRSEAESTFGNPAVYMEKFLQNPKHIEVQILGDQHGNVLHLFERDCSVQRRNQKVIEEALSAGLTEEERDYICSVSAKAMQKMGYYSAGTIEYLYEDGKFYFMEMNTRLQVEHPVTESITGIDIVYEMIRIARGKKLKHTQQDIHALGHAIECRINAEDPATFMPTPGKIKQFHPSAGGGVRLDTAIYSGYSIPPYYDSMIAKLIVHGTDREHCLLRLRRALNELIIEGTKTNIPLHLRLIEEPEFIAGTYTIKWLEKLLAENKA